MISLQFDSEIVQFVIDAVSLYDTSGQYPNVNEIQLMQILDCVLFFQIDSFIEHLIPLIAQKLCDISKTTLKRIPTYFGGKIVDANPIHRFDPDFIVENFGVDFLCSKFRTEPQPIIQQINPFNDLYNYTEENEVSNAANVIHASRSQFSSTNFVRDYCTIVRANKFDRLSHFRQLKSITIQNADPGDSILQILAPTLLRIEFYRTRLKKIHIEQLLNYLPTSGVVFLAIRDCHIGTVGCSLISQYLINHPHTALKYVDIAYNYTGASEIANLINATINTSLEAIAFDGNFFNPESEALVNLSKIPCASISLRGIHWDHPTADIVKNCLSNPTTNWWDLSAQTIHMNSNPDLSGPMAEAIFANSPPNISSLYFSNHRLEHLDLSFINKMNLTSLTIANSNISMQDLEVITPILPQLKYLDVSHNNLSTRTPNFLGALATANNLEHIDLTYTDVGDVPCAHFIDLMRNPKLKVLRLAGAGLAKRSSEALVRLMQSNVCAFEELDLSGNSLFHVSPPLPYFVPSVKTPVKKLILGGNEPKSPALAEFLQSVRDVRYFDAAYFQARIIKEAAQLLPDLEVLVMSYIRSLKDTDIATIAATTRCRSLYLVNAVGTNTLSKLLLHWAEMPMLLQIHIGTDIKAPTVSPIPIIEEGKVA